MSEFLVLSRRRTETFDDQAFAAVVPTETARVRKLYADGIIRSIWLRTDLPGAAFLVEAQSLSAAKELVDSLPMAAERLSEFTVIGLTPYRGFGPQ